MEKEILLNDQGIKFKCIIDNDNIIFEFPKSLSFLEKLLKVDSFRDTKYVRIGLKRILKIKDDNIEKMSSISTTEIRVLRAIYNNIKVNNKKTNLITNFNALKNEIKYALSNMSHLNKRRWDDNQKLHTELHTHLIEILNPYEFIDFLNLIGISYPLDYEGNINFEEGINYSYKEIVMNGWEEKLASSLRLDIKEVSDFDNMEKVIRNRERLLKIYILKYTEILSQDKEWIKTEERINEELTKLEIELMQLDKNIEMLSKKKINEKKQNIKTKMDRLKSFKSNYFADLVYNELFDKCLEKLEKEKIEYSEISFSNEKRLKFICDTHKDNKKFKFLFSIDRMKSESKFRDASKSLEGLLESGMVIGIDIMGFEHSLESQEYDSFKEKLEWLLPVLHIHPNSVLRIHAGEFKDCTKNVLNSLKAIKECSKNIDNACLNLFGESWGMVPPPRIRIGHGINIEREPELIELIKELDAVIEFNISSNYALGHVNDLTSLPLDYYDKEGIKYVIATDGGGMYSTSILQEQNIINNLEVVNVSPTKQSQKADLITKSEKTEREIIEASNSKETVSEKDRSLYEKYSEYKKSKRISEKKYSSYTDALEVEKSIFFEENKTITEYDKVNLELFRLRRYIMDNNVEIDEDYVFRKMDLIEKYNEDKKSDFAKIFLFLLEKEKFSEIDTSFKSLEYLSDKNIDFDNELENDLSKLFEIVSRIYDEDSENFSIKRR